MPIARQLILKDLTFGERIAEEETSSLDRYFVETDQWRRIYSGDIDIVYGAKGSGKSALYALLIDRATSLFDRNILLLSAENPKGNTVFSSLVMDPPTGEAEFIALWKAYLLSLVAGSLYEYCKTDPDAKKALDLLSDAKLFTAGEASLARFFRNAYDYVRRSAGLEGTLSFDPVTGAPVATGKIVWHAPTHEEAQQGKLSFDEVFGLVDSALSRLGVVVWVLLDRLDVAFADSPQFEANALRALFKVYLDLLGSEHIRLKIFLRTDIWKRITDAGFREASHITKHVTIKWDSAALFSLTVRRALISKEVREYFGITKDPKEFSDAEQTELMDKLFPDQVEVGPNKPKTFGWVLGRTTDGTENPAPRELIHFLNSLAETQLRRIEQKQDEDQGDTLFSRASFKDALPEVSRVRLEQTLLAEHAELKNFIMALEKEKTSQNKASLAKIWSVGEAKAGEIAESLAAAGLFVKKGQKDNPDYWVPFIYRPALKLVQGTAESDD